MTPTDLRSPVIACARTVTLTAADGRTDLVLFSACGACMLGHGRSELVAALALQVQGPWLLGGLEVLIDRTNETAEDHG